MEHLRNRGRERARLSPASLEALEACAPNAEDWQQQREALFRCMDKLSPAQRRLTALAYGDGLTPAQIAEREGKAANVIHVLLSRMRRALRDCVVTHLGSSS
jgi:RNA polymerase sigma factor (sigma-70 family)